MKPGKTYKMTYRKDNGDTSDRVVFVLTAPSENYLTFDLSNFSEEDRADIVADLTYAYASYINMLKEIQLDEHYRNFKKSGVLSHSST